jgi:hypothetical protein
MCASNLMLAYFSPETMLPLSSLIATIVGFALLVKRNSIRFVAHCCREALRTIRGRSTPAAPHFREGSRRRSQKLRR